MARAATPPTTPPGEFVRRVRKRRVSQEGRDEPAIAPVLEEALLFEPEPAVGRAPELLEELAETV